MNQEILEEKLAELPLYCYQFFDPQELEFSQRVRWICEHECPMYGKSWACPPGVGSVETCQEKCMRHKNCLMIATVTEVPDIADITQTLATRTDHEDITNQVGGFFREQGVEPYILSTAPSARGAPSRTACLAATRGGWTPAWKVRASTLFPRWSAAGSSSSTGTML